MLNKKSTEISKNLILRHFPFAFIQVAPTLFESLAEELL